MHVKILEEKGTRLVFEVDGATHTLCNMLKEEMWNDPDVKISGYHISHPYVGKPRFVIETKSSGNPRKAVFAAIKRLQKIVGDLGKKAAKELK